jgi:hypothetical protein
MSRTVTAALVAAGAVALSACGSTTFNSTWKAPDAQPIKIEPGEKVLAMVISPNQATRRASEAALAAEISRKSGADVIPSYTIVPDDAVKNVSEAKPYIEKSGCELAVIMRVTGKDKELSGSGPMYGPAWGGYGGFYGGFYGWGWGAAYSPGYLQTDTIVHVETLVYNLKTDKLIWAGESQTMNPSKAEGMIKELMDEAANEMRKDGLIAARSS